VHEGELEASQSEEFLRTHQLSIPDVPESRRTQRTRLFQAKNISQEVAVSLCHLLEGSQQLVVAKSSHEDPPKYFDTGNSRCATREVSRQSFKIPQLNLELVLDPRRFLKNSSPHQLL
jgi:hypothetical protein